MLIPRFDSKLLSLHDPELLVMNIKEGQRKSKGDLLMKVIKNPVNEQISITIK